MPNTMNIMDNSNTDEYFMTASQIFDYCGTDNTGTLCVDKLMDKFAPFVKTNKAEYSYLRSLLDPNKSNPEISVSELAQALDKYSENQKTKVDFDESFNLKSGRAPQDSDSGISTDGYQLLEDLQCELREKAHLVSQLRNQLDFTDRQHEEALVSVTAERDSLRAHLNMLREENMTLINIRNDYEEACSRLCSSEASLDETRKELDSLRRRARVFQEQVTSLENEKLTLQELLAQSKAECHRINDMYASRQSTLLGQNESLKTECADLSTRLQDQEEVMQQALKEKILVEMELKDMLNKSNLTHHRLERSIDVSYTDDQVLNALDSLNADSRFVQEHHLLDEDSFIKSPKEDHGRPTNLSLFDEIRLSFGNVSRPNFFGTKEVYCDKCNELILSTHSIESKITIANQTDFIEDYIQCKDCEINKEYAAKLESDLKQSYANISSLQLEYESNLEILQDFVNEGNGTNKLLQENIDDMNVKLEVLQANCEEQRAKLNRLSCDKSCAQCQTASDVASVSTQVDKPCLECDKRSVTQLNNNKTWKKFLWDTLKSLFSIFAGICLLSALIILYNVSNYHYAARRCVREPPAVPWQWLNLHDLFDFVFRIEYIGEVPM